MFTLFDYALKLIFVVWLGAFGVGFADMALRLHDQLRWPIGADLLVQLPSLA